MLKTKIFPSSLFACSAIVNARLLITFLPDHSARWLLVCALAFSLACVLIFFVPRLGYVTASLAGISALFWFIRIELINFPPLNTWILFNVPGANPIHYIAFIRVLFVAIVLTSTLYSITRLLPTSWKFRERQLSESTWPASALSSIVIAVWYLASVTPYRVPYIVDGAWPQIGILHVQKDGTQFHEESIRVSQDARFYVERNDRRLFNYRFEVVTVQGVLSTDLKERAHFVSQSQLVTESPALPANPLRAWRSEGWFVRTKSRILAFTTENGEKPPEEIMNLFREVGSAAPSESGTYIADDICLGFCYDPLAGLGLKYLNDRCKDKNGTRCK